MSARRSAVITAATVAASLLTGCGSSGSSDKAEQSPLPAEQLLAGPAEVTPEAGGTSAVLVATTKAKAACRVFYGRSPAADEGSATDTDMADGPHTTHRAMMTGLTPNTTYYYRFEGTDDAGRAYSGAGGTFRTAAAVQPSGKNLSKGAKITAFSSEFSEQYAARNAIDGDPATEWSTNGDGDKASITIDLRKVRDITSIGFRTRSMSDGSAVIKEIAVVVDGRTYGPFKVGSGETLIPLKVSGRVVLIKAVFTTGGNTGAQDIAVYGT